MTRDEWRQYWMPAKKTVRKYFSLREDKGLKFDVSATLHSILGIELRYFDDINLTDDLKHKLSMLGGTHGEIILKAMLAMKEEA